MAALKIYYCLGFKGHYPVGVAGLIAARSKTGAKDLLEAALDKAGLTQTVDLSKITEFNPSSPCAEILLDGDY